MKSVVLLLGGNIGNMREVLAGVRAELERSVGAIVASSNEIESDAWGFECESNFTNQALELTTSLSPEDLLDRIHLIEEQWGRDREAERIAKACSGERYTSRTIDIDIILYGEEVIESERLTVPHPLMCEREFVMEPIAEIMANRRHPVSGRTMVEILSEIRRG